MSGDNGGELKTPGGWFIKVGGPLAVQAVLFGLIFWWIRVDVREIRADVKRDHGSIVAATNALRDEIRLMRCLQMIGPAERLALRAYLQRDEDFRRYCGWLDRNDLGGPPP